GNDGEGYFLTFAQRRQPRLFDGADVNEHVTPAIGRLDKAVPLLRVEPFDGAGRHFNFLVARAYLRDRAGIARISQSDFRGSALQVAAMNALAFGNGRNSIAPKAERNQGTASR